ncbi:CAT RNA binding domain-containing protein [Lacrimispora sp. 38-1]|uniref:CAT RNA binding domain-containing protein n=1 Tax=Lacrimispora sp. 38-1 TaxID=3125778 RepID=UPI003CF69F25
MNIHKIININIIISLYPYGKEVVIMGREISFGTSLIISLKEKILLYFLIMSSFNYPLSFIA